MPFANLKEAFAKVLEDNQDCGLVLVGDGEYKEKYDLVVSRAVANLSTLGEYCIPFVKSINDEKVLFSYCRFELICKCYSAVIYHTSFQYSTFRF